MRRLDQLSKYFEIIPCKPGKPCSPAPFPANSALCVPKTREVELGEHNTSGIGTEEGSDWGVFRGVPQIGGCLGGGDVPAGAVMS